jgi:Flp pilus assembly protein TadG
MNIPTPEKKERGAAAVEFAIILPLLMLLIFGGIEFGLVMFNKQVLTNASREAARAGIVNATPRRSEEDMSAIALDYCEDYLVTFNPASPAPTVTITYEDPTSQGFGTDLTVMVRYNYEFLLLPNLRNLFGGSATSDLAIEATTTMRYE